MWEIRDFWHTITLTNKALRIASVTVGEGKAFRDCPLWVRWRIKSAINLWSFNYWFKYRPLQKKIKKFEASILQRHEDTKHKS